MYKAKLIEHKGKQRIAVYFANKPDLIERFKKLADARWSATLKCWHIPDTIENREKFKLADVLISRLADEGKNILTHNPKLVEGLNPKSANVFIEIKEKQILIKLPKNAVDTQFMLSFRYSRWDKKNYAWVIPNYKNNMDLLNIYFDKRIKELKTEEPVAVEKPIDKQKLIIDNDRTKTFILTSEGKQKIEKYTQWLHSKRYSESTIKTYSEGLQLFLKYYNDKPISEITNEDVILFNNNYILKNKLSASYQNQILSAVKLFFREMEHTKINSEIIHRPKRPKLLPNVLSKEEIKQILEAHTNIKHKTMLSLIYSCGLRRNELIQPVGFKN